MEGIKPLEALDFAVLAGYFAVIILIGSYVAKYVRHAKDYFVAGAGIPWWFGAISLWMAGFSALAFVMYSEIGYKYGLTALTLYWVSVPCMLVGAYLFVGRWRRARMMSPIGFVEARFSPALRQVFVWTGFPLRFIDNSIKIYATAIFIVAAISNQAIDMTRAIWITGIVIIAFSFLGGQWSVLVTDFVQFIIKVLAAVFIFIIALREVGGIGTFLSNMPADFKLILHPPYDLYQYLTWIVLVFFSFNAGWAMIQKYNCVRSESDARKVVVGVAVWNLVLPLILFAPAMFARVVMPDLPDARFS
jgi:Na+/proline symporter